jgi:hypothetical protein
MLATIKRRLLLLAGLGTVVGVILLGKYFLYDTAVPQGLASILRGEPVSGAAEYSATQEIHRIVLLYPNGQLHPWNSALPAEWRATKVATTELVGVIRANSETVKLSYDAYRKGRIGYGMSPRAELSAKQMYANAELFEARTGTRLASFRVDGKPASLQAGEVMASETVVVGEGLITHEGQSVHAVDGTEPEPDTVAPFLEPFVHRWFVRAIPHSISCINSGKFSADGKSVIITGFRRPDSEHQATVSSLQLWDVAAARKVWSLDRQDNLGPEPANPAGFAGVGA